MSVLGDKIRARREAWLELDEPPRRALKIRRLPESRMGMFLVGKRIDLQTSCDCVVGWRHVTEADLLGQEVGASDEQEFDADALRELLADDVELLGRVNDHIVSSVQRFLEDKAAAEKN